MGINELKKITRAPRLSEEVALALEGRITRGELTPGDQLPTEKVLAETFGVSRAVVREAVARLRADGRIETRQGSGAFVALAPKSLNFRFWQGEGPALVELRDIFELRAMIETSVAELAARRRIPEDVATMARHLQAMDDALADGTDGSEADDNFHLAIASATHNTYAYRLVEFLGRHFSDSRRLAWAGPGATAPCRRKPRSSIVRCSRRLRWAVPRVPGDMHRIICVVRRRALVSIWQTIWASTCLMNQNK